MGDLTLTRRNIQGTSNPTNEIKTKSLEELEDSCTHNYNKTLDTVKSTLARVILNFISKLDIIIPNIMINFKRIIKCNESERQKKNPENPESEEKKQHQKTTELHYSTSRFTIKHGEKGNMV